MVADVRIDNREELIASLGRLPSDKVSDAELLFEALLKWREHAVERVVGEYAFALWDGAKRELLLGRDFLGLRPLHYHCGNGFFAFASMPSGLHALAEVPYALDTDFMVKSLAMLPPTGGRSPFAEIMRAQPAHLVSITSKGIRARKYWRPNTETPLTSRPDEYAEGLRHLFDEVIRAQLRGTGSIVATHLSSGLDSSAITATVARQHAPNAVFAFTAVPRGKFGGAPPAGTAADERALAALTAGTYVNIEHILVESSLQSPLEWLDRSFAYQQQPNGGLANANWGEAIHRRASECGAKVILKGGLGNITASYAGLECVPWLLAKGHISEGLRHAASLVKNGMPLSSLAKIIAGPFVPPSLWRAMRRLGGRAAGLRSYSAVNPQCLAQAVDAQQERDVDRAERPFLDPVHGRLAALSYGDAGGNAYKGVLAQWGLSIREPFADRRIVEYCLAVPPEEYIRGGVPRSLARRAFADRLPSAVIDNRVRGAQASDWYEALEQARPQIEAEIETFMRCTEARQALDPRWFSEALETWPTNDWNGSAAYHRYRIGLLRGVAAGHFMRKVAGTN